VKKAMDINLVIMFDDADTKPNHGCGDQKLAHLTPWRVVDASTHLTSQ
jgi:hypothetical protein